MKRFLKKLGLHSPDEMEKAILFKAQRNAYLFLVLALVARSFYESGRVFVYHTRLDIFPCFLLGAAALIQSFSQLVMTRNAVKDDTDSYETGPLVKLVVLACVVASAAAMAVAAVVLMGVRT